MYVQAALIVDINYVGKSPDMLMTFPIQFNLS